MLGIPENEYSIEDEQTPFASYLNTLWDILNQETALQDLKRKQRFLRKEVFKSITTDTALELIFLNLYYVSSLSVEEILSLNRNDFQTEEIQLSQFNRTYAMTPDLKDLASHLSLLDLKNERLFGGRSVEWAKQIIAKYPNINLDQEVSLYATVQKQSDFAVIPTTLKLKALPNYRGKGVTIAFIDSGFYPHPDLTQPYNRILAYYDVTEPNATLYDFSEASDQSWHGMQTSVSCAGNGFLSKGLYRGIASDANVVLIKVSGRRGTSTQNIVEGFNWAVRNKDKYNIKILNISMGSSQDISFTESEIDRAAELAVHAGITVVAAAGNNPSMPTTPPGNSPSVITVGGTDDQNQLSLEKIQMYWSSFGRTVDGYFKPEIVAPGIWVAAPILPNTQVYHEAVCLYDLKRTPDNELRRKVREASKRFSFLKEAARKPIENIREVIEQRIRQQKLIAQYYQHVDGTSFSSPITCSVIAQMLEIRPELTPREIKEILLETAIPLKSTDSARQGRGMINPPAVIRRVQESFHLKITPTDLLSVNKFPKIEDNSAKFIFKTERTDIEEIALAGDFNGWSLKRHKMEWDEQEKQWFIELFFPMRGTYHYKFVINQKEWFNDPDNGWKEPDGYSGYNNTFQISQSRKMKKLMTMIDDILVSVPRKQHDEPRRAKAVKHLDRLLQLPTSHTNYYIRHYFISRLTKVLQGCRRHFPKRRDAILWQLYNQGYIFQVKGLNIGFDIVTTQNVFNLYWSIPEQLIQSLAEALDMLFVSHRHPDHMDLNLIERMVRLEKLVVAPKEILHLLPRRVVGMEGNEERQLVSPMNRHIRLNVYAHRGRHVQDNNRFISHRNYEIETETGFCLLHTGDHDYSEFLKHISDIDILIFKYGHIHPAISDSEAVGKLLKTFRTRMFIPSGFNEIGNHLESSSYEAAREVFAHYPVPYRILTWGESLVLH